MLLESDLADFGHVDRFGSVCTHERAPASKAAEMQWGPMVVTVGAKGTLVAVCLDAFWLECSNRMGLKSCFYSSNLVELCLQSRKEQTFDRVMMVFTMCM